MTIRPISPEDIAEIIERFLLPTFDGATGTPKDDLVASILQVTGLKPVPETTFAMLPSPASYIGYMRVTDVGIGGSLWGSEGVLWRPVGGRVVLARNAVSAAAMTGNTTENIIDTIPIRGLLMGPNGCIEVETRWSVTATANNKTLRYRLGGVEWHNSIVANSFNSTSMRAKIDNRNGNASQISSNGTVNYSGSTGPFLTSTINTAVDQSLTITAQLANAADTVVRQSYEVVLYR